MGDEREKKIAEIMDTAARLDDKELQMLAEFLTAALSGSVTSVCKCGAP